MRIFIAALVLIFSLQTFIKAEDIRDFEIEGISIGDSLLDFYTEEEILNRKKTGFLYPNKEYFTARLPNKVSNLYERLQFQIKADDLNYKIYSIEGVNFPDNIKSCINDKKNIALDIKKIFPNAEEIKNDGKHTGDPTGESYAYETYYMLQGGNIIIACYDWSDELTANKGWLDNLKVIIDSKEFLYWLNNKAYN